MRIYLGEDYIDLSTMRRETEKSSKEESTMIAGMCLQRFRQHFADTNQLWMTVGAPQQEMSADILLRLNKHVQGSPKEKRKSRSRW